MKKQGVVHFTQTPKDCSSSDGQWPMCPPGIRFVHVLYTPDEYHQFTVYERDCESIPIKIGEIPKFVLESKIELQDSLEEMQDVNPTAHQCLPTPSKIAASSTMPSVCSIQKTVETNKKRTNFISMFAQKDNDDLR
eukprot:TRINITY_DN9849_c0_g1_i1.p1 TRINITY_DN9849_c0_g1~~TRINITY_DN9849_c0_g1_i1.p1  ORF type:complete len:152 (+),score=17.30 TRINITY_DN9849_c0_g1_i1:49-456(+)